MQHWQLVLPETWCTPAPPPSAVETRGDAGRRAAQATRVIDNALHRTPCVWCESGLYDSIPPLCPGCGRVRALERRDYERPVGVPIEHAGCVGRVLAVR